MIGRLERGRTAPSFETIAALTDALKVPAAALFGAERTGIESERRELLDRINRLLAQTSDDDLRRVQRVLRALSGEGEICGRCAPQQLLTSRSNGPKTTRAALPDGPITLGQGMVKAGSEQPSRLVSARVTWRSPTLAQCG
jgi:hypothetical protein